MFSFTRHLAASLEQTVRPAPVGAAARGERPASHAPTSRFGPRARAGLAIATRWVART